MKNFKQYFKAYKLLEEATKANTHLTHLEELVLTKGEQGYTTARGFITDLLSHLQGKSKRRVGTTVKWDGAPAMFVGKHPDTGKFFVGTKSIFNKEPKINYNKNDVELNHGHAPGLADKLKKALQILPSLGITIVERLPSDLVLEYDFNDSNLPPLILKTNDSISSKSLWVLLDVRSIRLK